MKKQGSYTDLLKPRILRGLLSLSGKGYFVEKGWLNSYLKKEALDPAGNPIPWLTYSFLDFIAGRLSKDITLFEYGAGNSTLYFAKFIKSIKSIENNKDWYQKIKSRLPSNVDIAYVSLANKAYENAILAETINYDIVLVDGRQRVACVKNALSKLSERGVIILDDAERAKYKEAFTVMKDAGFKELPFSGIAIGAINHKCTTIFYRSQNCLGI